MKSQNIVANGESVLKSASRPGETELERSKSAPTPQQIRERAFEIHIERGGIHGMDLDDWMQAGTRTPGRGQAQQGRSTKQVTRQSRAFDQGKSISFNRRYPTCIKKHSHLTMSDGADRPSGWHHGLDALT